MVSSQNKLMRLFLWVLMQQEETALILIWILSLYKKEKQEILSNPKFIYNFGIVLNQQIEYYGACTSLRVWYASGLEVEFGFVDPSWIEKPLDLGTKEVLLPAYRVLVDKESNFEDLNLRD